MPFYKSEDLTDYHIIVRFPLLRNAMVRAIPTDHRDAQIAAHTNSRVIISDTSEPVIPSRIPIHQLPLELLLHWVWLQAQTELPHRIVLYTLNATHSTAQLTIHYSTNPVIRTRLDVTTIEAYGTYLALLIKPFVSSMLWRPILGQSIFHNIIRLTIKQIHILNGIGNLVALDNHTPQLIPLITAMQQIVLVLTHYALHLIPLLPTILQPLHAHMEHLLHQLADKSDDTQYALNQFLSQLTKNPERQRLTASNHEEGDLRDQGDNTQPLNLSH